VTRYDLFRRRIAPIAFLAAIALLGWKTCHVDSRTHATIVLDFGEARPHVQAVTADLIVGGDRIGHFERRALPGMQIDPCRFEVAMPEDSGELRMDIELERGRVAVVRHLAAVIDGSTVSVPLARDISR